MAVDLQNSTAPSRSCPKQNKIDAGHHHIQGAKQAPISSDAGPSPRRSEGPGPAGDQIAFTRTPQRVMAPNVIASVSADASPFVLGYALRLTWTHLLARDRVLVHAVHLAIHRTLVLVIWCGRGRLHLRRVHAGSLAIVGLPGQTVRS